MYSHGLLLYFSNIFFCKDKFALVQIIFEIHAQESSYKVHGKQIVRRKKTLCIDFKQLLCQIHFIQCPYSALCNVPSMSLLLCVCVFCSAVCCTHVLCVIYVCCARKKSIHMAASSRCNLTCASSNKAAKIDSRQEVINIHLKWLGFPNSRL